MTSLIVMYVPVTQSGSEPLATAVVPCFLPCGGLLTQPLLLQSPLLVAGVAVTAGSTCLAQPPAVPSESAAFPISICFAPLID